jgi:hypothetical protein
VDGTNWRQLAHRIRLEMQDEPKASAASAGARPSTGARGQHRNQRRDQKGDFGSQFLFLGPVAYVDHLCSVEFELEHHENGETYAHSYTRSIRITVISSNAP